MKKILFAILLAATGVLSAVTPAKPEVIKEVYIAKYIGPISQREWESRGRNGQVITTYNNGITISSTYADGYLNGPQTTSFPHSTKPSIKEEYDNDVRVTKTHYYITGNPQKEEAILPECQLKISHWYSNGVPQFTETYEDNTLISGEYFTKSGEREGFIEDGCGVKPKRDAFGILQTKESYKNGVICKVETYFPNNELAMVVPYNNGLIHGEVRSFQITGEPLAIENWSNGYKEGLSVIFQNGAKVVEVPYIAGLKTGVERRFQNETDVVEEISWREDKKHGKSCVYLEGMPHEQYYLQGKKVHKIAYEIIRQGPTKNL